MEPLLEVKMNLPQSEAGILHLVLDPKRYVLCIKIFCHFYINALVNFCFFTAKASAKVGHESKRPCSGLVSFETNWDLY